ncbi:MAG: Mur ligase family protein [Myxococcota bacterium]|nr:Mur ligase family protein [Myxococcota bacterium]
MQYADLLARLLPARRFGMVFGLDRIRALLDTLGAPDARLGTVIHVAGTNGKGSTVAMIAGLARASGVRVATFTSPHLSSLRERITFDGVLISEEAICAAAERVYEVGGDALTFFEQLTAIACVAIADNADVTILEVGLGGRLDATNAITAPIAIVTGVAMDHQEILGDTLQKIAMEKAGIFKPGQRAVIGASGEAIAQPWLEDAARTAGVETITVVSSTEHVPPVSLPGEHQRQNAAGALAALDHLEALGVAKLDDAGRAAALAHVVHPGRFEVIEGWPRIILDGAHNPHGAAALAAVLRGMGERPVLILGVSEDKDARGIVAELAPVASDVIATRYQHDRAMDPEALATIAREFETPVEVAPDLAAADALARAHHATIVIAGSLFLVGEARVRYLDAPSDPIFVTDPSPK